MLAHPKEPGAMQWGPQTITFRVYSQRPLVMRRYFQSYYAWLIVFKAPLPKDAATFKAGSKWPKVAPVFLLSKPMGQL